jgi:hypothetical protein
MDPDTEVHAHYDPNWYADLGSPGMYGTGATFRIEWRCSMAELAAMSENNDA